MRGREGRGPVGFCTLFLTVELADPRKTTGAQSSRSETLKHQRERHYPERTRKQNRHKHTHWTRPEIKPKQKVLNNTPRRIK